MSDFKMGFPEVVGTLQAMANAQAGQLQDILEAVRALKPAPLQYDALDSAEAHIELQKSVVARGYQSGDGALMASLYAANKRQLAEVERLQKVVADQALTIATLRDTVGKQTSDFEKLRAELAETKHLLEEERALTAATVGEKL